MFTHDNYVKDYTGHGETKEDFYDKKVILLARDPRDVAVLENMKRMEQQRVFWLSGGRLVPKDRSNPDSYKVRRGKVAGYRDDFDAAQLAEIDRLVESGLDPLYGYTRASSGGRDRGPLEGAA
jgi:hypothetical protein